MKKFVLDLKSFDYDGHDDDKTVLKHRKEGHTIVLNHANLSKNALSQLKAMHKDVKHFDEGGKVPVPQQKSDPSKSAQPHEVPANVNGPSSVSEALSRVKNAWAEGGQIKKPENTINYDELRKRKREMNVEEASKPVMPKRKKYADGGDIDDEEHVTGINVNAKEPGYTNIKHMADGGMANPYEAGLPCLNTHCKSHGKPHPNCKCYGPGGPAAEGYAEGGQVNGVKYCAYGFPHHHGCEYAKGVSMQGHDVREGRKEMAKDEAKGRAAEERFVKPKMKGLADGGPVQQYAHGSNEHRVQLEDSPELEDDVPQDDGLQPMDPDSPEQAPTPVPMKPDYSPMAQKLMPQAKPVQQMEMPQENVMAEKPKQWFEEPPQLTHTPMPTPAPGAMQPVAADNPMTTADEEARQARQAKTPGQHALEEDQKMGYDMQNGHIEPKTYHDLFTKQTTAGKMGMLFSILLGGIGSGITHQPNAALQMMDNVLNKDFEARKESRKNQINIWDMNYKHAKEMAEANNVDVNSDYAKQQLADHADALYQLQIGRVEYQKMIDRAKSLPPGQARNNAFEAAAVAGQALDKRAMRITDQLDSKIRVQNQGKGLPENTSVLYNPHPSIMKPPADSPKAPKGNAMSKLNLPNVLEDKYDKSQKPAAPEKPVIYNILSPDAQHRHKTIMAGNDPMWSPNKDKIDQQFTAADQAERVLNGPKKDGVGGIHDLMKQMYANIGNGSALQFSSHVRRAVEEGAEIPYVGKGVEALTDILPRSDAQKQYKQNAATLQTDIATALANLMPGDDVRKIVRANLPELGDSPEMVQHKEQNIVNMILKATKGSNLRGARMLRSD